MQNSGFECMTTAWGVTPQGQKTGVSPGRIVTASPYKTKGAQHGDVLHAFVRNGKGPLYFYKYATPLFRSCSVMLLLWQTVQKVQGLFGDSCKIVVHHAFLPKIVKLLCRSVDDY